MLSFSEIPVPINGERRGYGGAGGPDGHSGGGHGGGGEGRGQQPAQGDHCQDHPTDCQRAGEAVCQPHPRHQAHGW